MGGDLLIPVLSTEFLKTGCSVFIRSNGAWTDGFALPAESVMLVALKPLYASFAGENPQHLLSFSAVYVGWHLPNAPVLSPWVCCLIKPLVQSPTQSWFLEGLAFQHSSILLSGVEGDLHKGFIFFCKILFF